MPSEHVVAHVDDLKDGQMKEVDLDQVEILLVRLDGEYRAFGAYCPHLGAPLAAGLLRHEHVLCPWHCSVFEMRQGRLMQPPSLDSLPRFAVRIDGDEVKVEIPDEVPLPEPPPMVEHDTSLDGRTFVIVGSGAAGLTAAETLRWAGFRGRIVMLTRDEVRPYDRTFLSKQYLARPDAGVPFLRPEGFYEEHGIEILTNHRVAEVDVKKRVIRSDNGFTVKYDRALLCTGSTPRRLGVPGEDLKNVFVLRTLEDCEKIREAATNGKTAVLIGSSFIAMEVAASLTQRGIRVTVIGRDELPFAKNFGPEIGQLFRDVHEEAGAQFEMKAEVERFEGTDRFKAVRLKSGKTIKADFAVIGVGVRQDTSYLRNLEANEDGSLTVDRFMQAGPDLWAAGDIASFPDWRTEDPIRIEHWRLAQQHGMVAAMNMAGKKVPYEGTAFFWTNQLDLNMQYAGYVRDWDEVVIEGDVPSREFIAYYLKDGRVFGIAANERNRELALGAEMIRCRQTPTVEQIRGAYSETEEKLEV